MFRIARNQLIVKYNVMKDYGVRTKYSFVNQLHYLFTSYNFFDLLASVRASRAFMAWTQFRQLELIESITALKMYPNEILVSVQIVCTISTRNTSLHVQLPTAHSWLYGWFGGKKCVLKALKAPKIDDTCLRHVSGSGVMAHDSIGTCNCLLFMFEWRGLELWIF